MGNGFQNLKFYLLFSSKVKFVHLSLTSNLHSITENCKAHLITLILKQIIEKSNIKIYNSRSAT